MNFNSVEFLIFLPTVLLLYWIIPHKFRWILLLLASYYFYMSWNVWLIFLIVGTTLVSYLAGIFIERTQKQRIKKLLLVVTLVVCLGILVFFKYFNFLLQSAIDFLNLFSMRLNDFSLNIVLPIGISFYTFQTLSYVIDVYRGKIKPEKHFGYYALFVCYFPQLVAGPIERPGDLIPQLKAEHKFDVDDFLCGLRILLVGFFYKCVAADFLGAHVSKVFANLEGANALSVIIAGLLFAGQMYCDFAGYSEIATGAARMMGVKLTRNFDRPYIALSYSDFFRRWHITLTRWFIDYLYIPLGGNRKGKVRRTVNTFIVFLLCGLWHGANWTYVVWGGYAAVFLTVESLLKKPIARFLTKRGVDLHGDIVTLFRRVALFAVFIPSALIFRAESMAQVGEIFVKLFTAWGGENFFAQAAENAGLTSLVLVQIVLSLLCVGKLWHFGEIGRERKEEALPLNARAAGSVVMQRMVVGVYAVLAIMLCWVALSASGDVSAFRYFQF